MKFTRKWPLGVVSGSVSLMVLVPLLFAWAGCPMFALGFFQSAWPVVVGALVLGAWALRRASRPHSIRLDRDRVVVTGLLGLFPCELVRDSLDAEKRSGAPVIQVVLETSALVTLATLSELSAETGGSLLGWLFNLLLCQRYWAWRRAEHFWLMGVDRRGRSRRVVLRTRAFHSWGELRAQLLGGPAHCQSETERWEGVIDTNAIARPVLVAAEPVGVA